MAKRKAKLAFPKRIMGMKVPKRLRKFASTPVGSAIIAEAVLFGAAALIATPAVRRAAGHAGQEAIHAGAAGADLVGNVVKTALMPVVAAAHDIVDRAETYRHNHSEKHAAREPLTPSSKASSRKKKDYPSVGSLSR